MQSNKLNMFLNKLKGLNLSNPLYLKAISILFGGVLISGSIILSSRGFDLKGLGSGSNPTSAASDCSGDNRLADGCYVKYAEDLDLDKDEFTSCIKDNKFSDVIDKELASGEATGVRGTPTLYMGKGEESGFKGFYIGGASIEEIKTLVEKLSTGDVDSTNKFWVDTVKGGLVGLEQQARDYYQSEAGGSLTGDVLETTVKTFIDGQLADINTNFVVKDLSVGDGKIQGKGDVILMEFSDYECPYCFTFASETLVDVKSELIDKGKAKYVFRDFPLEDIHPKARPAAIAARCAGDQGKYFEYHDKLFSIN